MNKLKKLIENASNIEAKLGYVFNNKHLMALAFVHRSFINENREIIEEHNERLEFLGDSVLGVLVAEYLYQYLPENPEGDLSHLRSRLVESTSCVSYIQKLNVEIYMLFGKGESMNTDRRGRTSILADLFEAIIGAIYLDGGIEAAKSFLFGNFIQEITAILNEPLCNWKAELQDYAQKNHQQTPVYKVINEEGPDHSKTFHVCVFINKDELGSGQGASKKEAQQVAASVALSKLNRFLSV